MESRARDLTGVPLLGRELDLGLILEQVKRVEREGGAVVVVRGEAGIGKTRLMAEAVARARLFGHIVLEGRANVVEQSLPYSTMLELLRSSPDRDSPGSALGAASAVLEPGFVTDTRASTPGTHHVLAACFDLVASMASTSPTVLAIDDLHVADDATVALVTLLARRLADSRVLILATSRHVEPGRRPELDWLGPFRWRPSPAKAWTRRAARRRPSPS